jgi:pyruvate/2-oxoglutarate dehydrogenase complex dihydrolipoamide acyltransferase (E2) component
MKHDILAFLSQGGAADAISSVKTFATSPPPPQSSAPTSPPASSAVAHGGATTPAATATAAAAAATPLAGPGDEKVEPVRGYMRTMIKTMQAQTSVPHMGLCEELNVDGAVELREAIRPAAESKGVKLSLLPIIIKAMSHSLNEFPEVGSPYPCEGRPHPDPPRSWRPRKTLDEGAPDA